MKRLLVAVVVTIGIIAGPATVAGAATGGDFGGHVADCAQTMGFSGDHNPGMHHGYAGWPGEPCAT